MTHIGSWSTIETTKAFCSNGVDPDKGSILQYKAVFVNSLVGTATLQNAHQDRIQS